MWREMMRKPFVLISLMIVALGLLCRPVHAHGGQKVLKLDEATSRYKLAGHVEVYEDKTGAETIDTIRSKPFHPVQTAAPNFGFTRSAFWTKLTIVNPTSAPQKVLLETANPYLDFIDIFVTSDSHSALAHYRAGARVPFDETFSGSRYPVLELSFAPGEEKTILVRAKSDTSVRLPLVLSTEEAYRRDELNHYLFLGLFLGALVFLTAYSLLAWSILRQRAYLYYILTIACVGAFQLAYSGLVPRVSIFSQPERMMHLVNSGIGITCVFNIMFVSS